MKRAVLVVVALLLLIAIEGNLFCSSAVELTPYVRLGTINWREKGVNEGHKFLQAGGLRIVSNFDKLSLIGGVEAWKMGEPIDEDTEMPRKGYRLSGEIRYKKSIKNGLSVYPYAGLGFEEFSRARDGNYKYSGS